MDVTASLVSLIQFTIKGIQVVHKIATSIKEGPDTVVRVAKHAGDLLHILQRLERSPSMGQSLDARLLDSMKACNADVTKMAQKLANAGFRANDKLGVRLWKSVKSALNEKEWKEFQTKLQEYLNSLNLFIVVENREKLFDMSQTMDVGHESIQDMLASLIAKFDGIESKFVQLEPSARTPQCQAVIDAVRQEIQGQLQLRADDRGTPIRPVVDKEVSPQLVPGSSTTIGQSSLVPTPPKTTDVSSSSHSDSKEALDIVKDNALLVDGVKTLVAESARQLAHKQQWKDAGVVLYREIRFEPDTKQRFRSVSPAWVNGNPKEANFQAVSSPVPHLPFPSMAETRPSPGKKGRCTLEEVLKCSANIDSFFSLDCVRPGTTPSKTARVNKKTTDRLEQWSSKGSGSRTLWFKGRYMPERGAANPLTRIVIGLVELAAQSEVPLVSYFSRPGRSDEQRGRELPEEMAFTSTLYALIYQILRLLPAQFELDVDLSEEQFRRLDGTKASWEDAVRILKDIIQLLDRPVYCILDGVQWVEHSNTDEHLRLVIAALRQEPMRALFITSGLSRVLRGEIPRAEILADEELSVARQGQDLQRDAQALWKE